MRLKTKFCLAFAVSGMLCQIVGAAPYRGGYYDVINQDAAPADETTYGNSLNNVGWYYTPTTSYTLTGISSSFYSDEFGHDGPQTVTVQIQTDRPSLGGIILGEGTFVANGFEGAPDAGASFAPVQLTAGTTYFVDFLNVAGLNVNLGQWANVNGTHVPTIGATTRLDAFYVGAGSDTSFATARVGNGADQVAEFGPVSGVEPILLFNGTAAVPEPGSLVLLSLGGIVLASRVRRRR